MNYEMPMTQGRELPTLYGLRQIDLPEVATLEVGDSRYVVMKIKMIGKRSGPEIGSDDKYDQTKFEGDFKIHSIKVLGKEPVDAKSLESKEFRDVVNKVLSGQM